MGAGGEGDVWLAWDPTLQRQVVCKRLRRGDRSDVLHQSLIHTLASLESSHIPAVHAVIAEHDSHWIVLAHVPGLPLSELFPTIGERPGLVPVLDILIDLCDALIDLHASGVVHADISPANVLVDQHGRARLIDFGQARRLGETLSGCAVEGFLAPEADHLSAADVALDSYALGCILYWLLGEQPPMQIQGHSNAVMLWHPDMEQHGDEWLSTLARSLTDPSPDKRPALDGVHRMLVHRRREFPAADSRVLAGQVGARLPAPLTKPGLRVGGAPGRDRGRVNRRRQLGLLTAAIVMAGVASALLYDRFNITSTQPPVPPAEIAVRAIDITPLTPIPDVFDADWLAHAMTQTMHAASLVEALRGQTLQLSVRCDERLCQLSLAHHHADTLHWHQQSLMASGRSDVWRAAVSDLTLLAAVH